LYRQHFDPVMGEAEFRSYFTDVSKNADDLRYHVDVLCWAEGLLFVFPTWFFGPPAMLKGWLERVWLPGLAFSLPASKGAKVTGGKLSVRWLCCITTSGSPWWWIRLAGDPCRKLFTRGLRALLVRRCKVQWLQLCSMDHATGVDRSRFLDRVGRTLATVR
jgi:NAD(P)H dehydrogenase (quinone)